MADKKNLTTKDIEKKIIDLKIELLRSPMKRGNIKREIARLLTMGNSENRKLKIENRKKNTLTKSEDVKN